LKTPTGVITEGSHDFSLARYTYEPDNDGDETVTSVSALDDLHPAPDNIKLLTGVTHGKLMTDHQFLDYFYRQLAHQVMIVKHADDAPDIQVMPPVKLAPGSSVP